LWRRDGTLAACAAGLFGLAALRGTDLPLLALMPALLLCCAQNGGRARALLLRRPGQYLGEISYALYMTHMATGAAVFGIANTAGMPRSLPLAAAMFAAALIGAILVSRFVEYPARALLRAWFRRAVPTPSIAAG
jgi:peptidoglycan/LPS O-acetylase OafA/YrhL